MSNAPAHSLAAPVAPAADSYFQTLLDYGLERGYLEALSQIEEFPAMAPSDDVAWLQIQRLPIHPNQVDGVDLFTRWQGVLSSVHAWRQKLMFVLSRHGGQTRLFLGTVSPSMRGPVAANQLAQIATNRMPGIETRILGEDDVQRELRARMRRLTLAGTVTGLPSLRESTDAQQRRGAPRSLQTLDQLAFGLRSVTGSELDYALVVVAEPLGDREIADAICRLRVLGSRIHSYAKQTASQQQGDIQSGGLSVNVGALTQCAGLALSLIPGGQVFGPLVAGIGTVAGAVIGGYQKTRSHTDSLSLSAERIDKTVQYAEQLIDVHVKRLQRGRNLGFWNTGVYVLAQSDGVLATLNGMLRTIYSGDVSYIEPIRCCPLHSASNALGAIQSFSLIPLPASESNRTEHAEIDDRATGWHPLGRLYEWVSTPLNTEELSITTSLPHQDVPGLRFVRNAIRFASNPPPAEKMGLPVTLGEIMDTGISLSAPYCCDLNALVRHALVTGTTGSGKSTTCRRLVHETMERGVPVLIVEPAKDEYVQWALEHNRSATPEKRFQVFMPGASAYCGEPLGQLRLNPFEPACAPGGGIDLLSRLERFNAILNASLCMPEVLPLLMEELLFEFMGQQCPAFMDGEMAPLERYPLLSELLPYAERVMARKKYEERIKKSFEACLRTRLDALMRGKRGMLLSVPNSTPWTELFEGPAVVNLSHIPDDRDKAFLMALLATALHEYRVSKYRIDPEYRAAARAGKLGHLAVIEEAHRLLSKPQSVQSDTGNPQEVVARMFSEVLSEMRCYGQGVLIVDQVPSRLIPDAIKNTNLKIVHRLVSKDDRQAMAWSMSLRGDQEDVISVLSTGEAIVCGDLDDAAAWVRMAMIENREA